MIHNRSLQVDVQGTDEQPTPARRGQSSTSVVRAPNTWTELHTHEQSPTRVVRAPHLTSSTPHLPLASLPCRAPPALVLVGLKPGASTLWKVSATREAAWGPPDPSSAPPCTQDEGCLGVPLGHTSCDCSELTWSCHDPGGLRTFLSAPGLS